MIDRINYKSPIAMRDALDREFERRDRMPKYPFGVPSDMWRDDSIARFGEACRTQGASIRLPFASQARIGQFIAIMNGSASVRCTVRPQEGETINGGSYVTLAPASTSILYVFSPTVWIVTSYTDSQAITSQTPFWEWNGTDTTQFLGPYKGQRVDTVALAVESYGGENWLSLTVNGSANYTYRETQLAVAPIDVVPPSANYRITYDLAAKTFAAGLSEYMGAGAIVRWVTGSYSGTYYAHYSLETPSTGSNLTRVIDGGHSSDYHDEAAAYEWDSTDHVLRNSLEAKNQILLADAFGTLHGWTDTDAAKLTAAGRPGIMCGHLIGTTDLTCAAYFRNIKVWDLGA